MTNTNVISTCRIRRNIIKLPQELQNHPHLKDADITIDVDTVTFKLLPAKPEENPTKDIWQYVSPKQLWVQVTFNK
jgi:hypothetical protein